LSKGARGGGFAEGDERRALVIEAAGRDPVDGFEDVGDEELVGGALGGDAAVVEEDEAVAVAGGECEVVEDDDGAEAEPVDEVEYLVLVADVEVVGGLVEEEVGGALGEGAGDHDALPLAAGELGDVAGAEVVDAGLGHGLFGAVVFGGSVALPGAHAGAAAQEDGVEHGA
jgi:hypothetical protein